ncbi:VIT1/CCC1 transporter family protein [soil metagenome]
MINHVERHFSGGATVRDIVIGMSDGLTVPFALAAGLAGAVASSRLVLTAGGAEIAAGSIAMGLGGYLAARGDAEHYRAERQREVREIAEVPEKELAEVAELLVEYGLPPEEASKAATALSKDEKKWVDFMMRFELGLEEPDPKRALQSGMTIAAAYIVGGIIPLIPYFFVTKATEALPYSAGSTMFALLIFGLLKGQAAGISPVRSALQTVLVGGIAAAAAFGLAKAFS